MRENVRGPGGGGGSCWSGTLLLAVSLSGYLVRIGSSGLLFLNALVVGLLLLSWQNSNDAAASHHETVLWHNMFWPVEFSV